MMREVDIGGYIHAVLYSNWPFGFRATGPDVNCSFNHRQHAFSVEMCGIARP
jgi:hypothetical protein